MTLHGKARKRQVHWGAKLLMSIVLSACSIASSVLGDGEHFSVGIIDKKKQFSYATVTDNVPYGVTVERNRAIGFIPPHAVRIPEQVDFTWQLRGENERHTKRMKLRSQLPPHVLQKIRGSFANDYLMSIDFVVLNDGPAIEWKLAKIIGPSGPFEYPEKGTLR